MCITAPERGRNFAQEFGMQDFCWTPASDGALVSEAGPCRLTVATIGGLPRFLVHRQAPDAASRAAGLLASGTRANLTAAMAAADAAAHGIAAADAPPGLRR